MTAPGGWVRVEKRKYPSVVRGSWEARVIGEDEHGLWLFAEEGVRNRHKLTGIQLLPRQPDRWWVAWWWADPNGWWCAADICTPATYDGDRWHYDDLEIDVVGRESGFWQVVDEDEFEESVEAVPYPREIVIAALVARDEVVHLMREFREPFGSVAWDLLREWGSSEA